MPSAVSQTAGSASARRTVHFHRCVIDGVFAADEDEQIHFAEGAALTTEHVAALLEQVRAPAPRWSAHSAGAHPLVIALQMAAFGR